MPVTTSELIADPTREHVLAYLEQRHDEYVERTGQPLKLPQVEFASEAQLAAMEQARAWWPADAEKSLSFGYALFSALSGYANPNPELRNRQLTDGLSAAAHRVVEWLIAEGRDPVHPNETPEERRRRMNRERVRRHRRRQGEPAHVSEARADLEEARAALREARAEARSRTRAAYDEMMNVRRLGDEEVAGVAQVVAEYELALARAQAVPEVPVSG